MYYKKSLGQHFLRDPKILGKIADAAKLTPSDTVLEVGPGEGTLTTLLLQKAGRVIAVEKDDRLIPALQQRFAIDIAAGKLELTHADILDIAVTSYMLHVTCYKVVANLPYYITGKFLRKFLESERQPTSMTLLLQKEVARRIMGTGRFSSAQGFGGQVKESLLSLGVKAYGTPRYIATVTAGSFAPPPKVDSAILTIENISRAFFEHLKVSEVRLQPSLKSDFKGTEKQFFTLLKRGFAHPRKLLSSNLDVSAETLQTCGVAARARAERVTLKQWKHLAALLNA